MASDIAFQPKNAVGESITASMYTGGAGLMMSAIQNSMVKHNIGALSVFTRTGGVIAIFAAMGGTYTFASLASANLREKDDTWNVAIGGFAGGAMLSMGIRTLPAMFGYGTAAAVLLSAFSYTGGRLSGYVKDPEVDEFERKERLRRNRRRPITETLEELGEGRGVFGPGYAERRRERLKENYGIDVPQ